MDIEFRVEQGLLMAVLGLWSALLVQRGIAVFHDGLRASMGEFVAGRLTRGEFAGTWRSRNQDYALWLAPATLATGIILTHVLLLPLDLIGARAKSAWRAAAAGALWGAALFAAVILARAGLAELPVDVVGALLDSLRPLVFAAMAIPVVATVYQFGLAAGGVGLAAVVVGHVANTQTTAISANVLAILAGLVVLAVYTARAEAQRRALAAAEGGFTLEPLAMQAGRIRRHLAWFGVQGALLALATQQALFGWFVLDISAAAHGFRVEAGLVALVITIGFLPTVVTSSLMTGVSQTVGLTLAFAVGYLAPGPAIAAAAGAAVMLAEGLLLERVGRFLDSAPTVREVGDSMRGAAERVTAVALTAGAMLAGGTLLPDGGGYLIVAGVIAANELSGARIPRFAEGPVAVLIAGAVANVLDVAGVR